MKVAGIIAEDEPLLRAELAEQQRLVQIGRAHV